MNEDRVREREYKRPETAVEYTCNRTQKAGVKRK